MNRGNRKQARWMWLDCRPTAASPICLWVCHPISQAAGGNWVHCSHHRISWIESFIIWITMNVNEPHVCSGVMGKNRSLLAPATTRGTSPNTYNARAFFVQSHAKSASRANMLISFSYSVFLWRMHTHKLVFITYKNTNWHWMWIFRLASWNPY